MEQAGLELKGAKNDDIRNALQARAESFRDDAPTTAADAAIVILDGVRNRNWRILVGQVAVTLDRMVRENPDQAYELAFMEKFLSQSAAGPLAVDSAFGFSRPARFLGQRAR